MLCSVHDALFEISSSVLLLVMVLDGRFGRSQCYLQHGMVLGIKGNAKRYHTSCLHCKAISISR